MNLNQSVSDRAVIRHFVSIPIRDLMNLNLCSFMVDSFGFVSIPIRDLMNLNLHC